MHLSLAEILAKSDEGHCNSRSRLSLGPIIRCQICQSRYLCKAIDGKALDARLAGFTQAVAHRDQVRRHSTRLDKFQCALCARTQLCTRTHARAHPTHHTPRTTPIDTRSAMGLKSITRPWALCLCVRAAAPSLLPRTSGLESLNRSARGTLVSAAPKRPQCS